MEPFALDTVYTKGDKVVWSGAVWTFDPPPEADQFSAGLYPNKANHWKTR